MDDPLDRGRLVAAATERAEDDAMAGHSLSGGVRLTLEELRARNREGGRKLIEAAGGVEVVRERLRAVVPHLFTSPQATPPVQGNTDSPADDADDSEPSATRRCHGCSITLEQHRHMELPCPFDDCPFKEN